MEAAQIVVPLTEPVGRVGRIEINNYRYSLIQAYGWQYQEAFLEEGRDHRFNNLVS